MHLRAVFCCFLLLAGCAHELARPPTLVTSPAQLPSLIDQCVELVGIVSDTKYPSVQGVTLWELEGYRGRTARVTGILRASVVTEQQLHEEEARRGRFAHRGPGTFYRLDNIRYAILP
jgi:hypothetical protein